MERLVYGDAVISDAGTEERLGFLLVDVPMKAISYFSSSLARHGK